MMNKDTENFNKSTTFCPIPDWGTTFLFLVWPQGINGRNLLVPAYRDLITHVPNDIDVNTLRALEEGLENFAGCAVVISHDRWFLDRIATHILAFEGDSVVEYFEGSYSEFEEYKKKKYGNVEPKRIRYKKLVAN